MIIKDKVWYTIYDTLVKVYYKNKAKPLFDETRDVKFLEAICNRLVEDLQEFIAKEEMGKNTAETFILIG